MAESSSKEARFDIDFLFLLTYRTEKVSKMERPAKTVTVSLAYLSTLARS